jgi:glycosyltransferase involved in cell wall biosynthesis
MRLSVYTKVIHFIAKFRHLKYTLANQTIDENSKLKITYLCPNAIKASGGTKIIYAHTSIINTYCSDVAQAQIFHAKDPKFRCHWQFENLAFKEHYIFDNNHELFIIHEMWAIREAAILANKTINYGIFVQNAYLINRKTHFEEAKIAYENAHVILCVSQDIHECLVYLFPHLNDKIKRLRISVDAEFFKPAITKQNIITYMPRKLKKHADLVLFFLAAHLPKNWRIEPIDKMRSDEVAKKLGESKIFMSFSELEGLGLPPIEAALAGNLVIGYTGQGGKEFWHAPLFEEIANGDIRGFSEAVLKAVQRMDNNEIDSQRCSEARSHLAQQYHANHERQDLIDLTQMLKRDVQSHSTTTN